jgi:hypothetical protein
MHSKTKIACVAALAFLATVASTSAQIFAYDNTETSSSGFFLNGGSANQSGNTITRLVADDITPAAGFGGMTIDRIYFSVHNENAAAVSARPRLRMWNADGAGGGPGTVIVGYSFSPISFAAGTSGYFYFNPSALTVPSGTFWMGLTFDDNTGGTGATAAQMDNLGMALFNPPSVGTSSDLFFQTTAAGSFFSSNPAGTLSNLNGNPPANFFFGVTVVPEPSSLALAGLAVLATVVLRRRSA